MYIKFYGFREAPFSLLPDPDFLYLSPQHEQALNLLQLAVTNRSGFCAISGPPGTGKTTLIGALLARLDKNVSTGLITDTYAGFSELLERILSAYELDCPQKDDVSRYKRFTDFVIHQYAANKNVLLIVDEAQNLSPGAMEQLRMLSNINADKHTMIQIMLIGQETLQDKLRSPYLRQLAQRIEFNHRLEALDAGDTQAYIQHRISKAGGPAGLFNEQACKFIHEKSDGVARVINRICDLSLVYGYAANTHEITAEMVADAAVEQFADAAHPQTTSNAVPAQASSAKAKTAAEHKKVPDSAPDVAAKRAGVAHASEQKAAAMALLMERTEAAKIASQQAESISTAAQRADAKNTATLEQLAKCTEQCDQANRQLEAERQRVKQLADDEKSAQRTAAALEEAARQAQRRADEKETALLQQLEETDAAEQQAIANATAATEAAQQALRDRIAAERAAAEASEQAELAVSQARETLKATEARIMQQLTTLSTTAERADADRQLAVAAAQQKSAELGNARAAARSIAQETQRLAGLRDEVATNAEQQALIAREMQEQAEHSSTEARQAKEARLIAEQDAAKLITAEKLLAAELADDLAQLARLEADRAARRNAVALRKAQEKEALAHTAAEQAAQAKADADKAAVAGMRILIDEDDLPEAESHNENADTASGPMASPISRDELATVTRLAAQARARRSRKGKWSLLAASAAGVAMISWVTIESDQPAPVSEAAIPAQAETAALELNAGAAMDNASRDRSTPLNINSITESGLPGGL